MRRLTAFSVVGRTFAGTESRRRRAWSYTSGAIVLLPPPGPAPPAPSPPPRADPGRGAGWNGADRHAGEADPRRIAAHAPGLGGGHPFSLHHVHAPPGGADGGGLEPSRIGRGDLRQPRVRLWSGGPPGAHAGVALRLALGQRPGSAPRAPLRARRGPTRQEAGGNPGRGHGPP